MSDEENEENEEENVNLTSTKAIRRRRPQHQTKEEKALWDKETKTLRNAKARVTRLEKKLTLAANSLTPGPSAPSIASLTLPPPPTTSPTSNLASTPSTASPAPPPISAPPTSPSALPQPSTTSSAPPQTPTNTTIDLTKEAVAEAAGRLLRLKIPVSIRDRMWQLHVSEPCTLSPERRTTGRIRVLTRKAKENTGKAARSWQLCP